MDEQEILQALEKKALGFEFDEVVEEYAQDADVKPVLSKRKITKKINPPDISALKFLLEKGDISQDTISKMTDKELLAERERLLKLLKENQNENGNL